MLRLKFDSFCKNFNNHNNYFTNLLNLYKIEYEIVDQIHIFLYFQFLDKKNI